MDNSIELESVIGPTVVVREADAFEFEFDLAAELRNTISLQGEKFLQRQNASIAFGSLTGAVAFALVAKRIHGQRVRGLDRLLAKAPNAVRPLLKVVLLGSRVAAVSSGPALLVTVAVTVGAEYVMLKYHEKKHRPQLRELIMKAIDDSQKELKREVRHLFDY